jgi:hypothetical protein
MADPQQSAPQSRYVQVPNGSYLEWPEGVSADEFKAKAAKVGATPTAEAPAEPQGALSSFGEASGLTGLKNLVTHPGDTLSKIPGGLIDEAGRVGSQLKEAWNTPNNEPMKAIDRTLYATPFVGGSLKKADEQAEAGNYKGAVGTGLGILANVATLGAGAGAAADAVPSTARAGEIFESLNKDLAQHPVPLNATLKPLQRITEIGERGGTLPAAVNKLLQRSQSPIEMTFPEARDYQSSLSDLSATDKMAMGGRVSGGLKQLSKALYSDIQDAADQAGRGDDYAQGMKEYRQGSGLKDSAKAAGKLALKGAGAYGAYSAMKDLTGK